MIFSKDDIHYQLVKSVYKLRVAKRTGRLYIDHINEGLIVLDALSATTISKQAFCLHPLLQSDKELHRMLQYNPDLLLNCSPVSIIIAMEYRQHLNRFSSQTVINARRKILISSLKKVMEETPYLRPMAIADKVQNRKDFLTYHKGKHPRSQELDYYFKTWLYDILEVDEEKYLRLASAIDCNKVLGEKDN